MGGSRLVHPFLWVFCRHAMLTLDGAFIQEDLLGFLPSTVSSSSSGTTTCLLFPLSLTRLYRSSPSSPSFSSDYPDFYDRLYAMLDRSVLHVKYRSRFFRLAETFLSSSFVLALPSSLVPVLSFS